MSKDKATFIFFDSRDNKWLNHLIGKEKGKECFEYPYDHFVTNRQSPTNKFGFIEPEGILKGSNIKLLINSAIIIAINIVFNDSIVDFILILI